MSDTLNASVLKDAQRWAALRDNNWTLYEVEQEVRIPNTSGFGPAYTKAFKRVGWMIGGFEAEFPTQDEAIDNAILQLAQTGAAPVAPSVPTPNADEHPVPLSEDQITDLARDYQSELASMGVEAVSLERMIRGVVSSAEDYLMDAEDSPWQPGNALELTRDVVRSLALSTMGDLLEDGVQEFHLKQMIVRTLKQAYPKA